MSVNFIPGNTDPRMRKYYIGISALTALVIAVIAINVFGSYALKDDYKLEQEIESLKTKIDTSARSTRKLPDTPLDVGVTETGGVEYKKISKSKYGLCATFKTKSDGYSYSYDYGDTIVKEGLMSGASLDASASYTDGNTDGLKHEKGYACIVYEPYELSEAYSKQYICGGTVYISGSQKIGPAKITAINSSTGVISLTDETAAQPGTGTAAPTPTYYAYNTRAVPATIQPGSAPVYDEACAELPRNSLQVGDSIYVYMDYSRFSTKAIQVHRAVR